MTTPVRPTGAPLVCHDATADRTVLVAPGRRDRPDDAALAGAAGRDPRQAAAWCPFCAGNEPRTPPAVDRAPADPAADWHARIVPNRYPVVGHAPGAAAGPAGRLAHGVHDVLVESAAHLTSVLAVPPAGWHDAWELCRRRLAALAARSDLAWGTVFKNSGPLAGASLEHVHSQIVALDFVPPAIRSKAAAAERAPDAFAALLRAAGDEGRVVVEDDGLVALVPPAPRQPLETWIVPREGGPQFHAAGPRAVAALARLTQDAVGRLARVAPGADYNWWLHAAPFRSAGPWCWHLEILPRLTPLAGFELGTGCHISTHAAAESAALLRGAAGG